MDKNVLHLDVADFAVAVERVRDASLVRRALIISHPSPRSPILCASSEARSWGVVPGMKQGAARRLCPDVSVLPPDERLYGRAQAAILKLLCRYSPVVESGRWGRMFADLSGTRRLYGPVRDTAQRIGRAVSAELRLLSHLGLSNNKSTSAVASRVGDDRLVDVFPGSEAAFLAPHPSGYLPGVERLENELLEELNIVSIGQFAEIPAARLGVVFGRLGPLLHLRARGCDPRPVRPREAKPTVWEEEALPKDTNCRGELDGFLYGLVERCGHRLRAGGTAAGWVRLVAGYSDNVSGEGVGRVHPVSNLDGDLFDAARLVLDRALQRRVRVSYMKLVYGGLAPYRVQVSLLPQSAAELRRQRLTEAMDAIRSRFGVAAIRRGGPPCPASAI